MTSLLVQAILDAWDRIRGSLRGRLAEQFTRLREAAEPPVGIVLSGPDGASYTGIVVVERNKAILLLALREPGYVRPAPPPMSPPARASPSPYDRQDPYGRGSMALFDHEHPPIDENDHPWRR